jgi:hypothetical protein
MWAGVAAFGVVACGGDGSDGAGGVRSPPGEEFGVRGDRIYEVREPIEGDGAPIASNNYFCMPCLTDLDAARAFDAHEFPTGFARSVQRTLEAARASLIPPENTRGAAQTLDLVPAIAGAEHELGAQPQFGEIMPGGVIVTMESTRRLEWDAGDELTELSDGRDTFVLFARSREPGSAAPGAMQLPTGWTRASRVLDAPFVLRQAPRVVVFLGLPDQHLFQRVALPEAAP